MPTARLYQSDGVEQEERVDLAPEVFGIEPNNHAVYEAEKMYLANQRQGTARTKTRAEIAYTGRKMSRQKGLGRARMGSHRSPSRVGGGRAHGPKPRNYAYAIPKKVRRLAIRSVLSARAREDTILVIEALHFDAPKTGKMADLLAEMNLNDRKCLILTDRHDEAVSKSCRNLPGVDIDIACQAHIHELLHSECLVFTRAGLQQAEEALQA